MSNVLHSLQISHKNNKLSTTLKDCLLVPTYGVSEDPQTRNIDIDIRNTKTGPVHLYLKDSCEGSEFVQRVEKGHTL